MTIPIEGGGTSEAVWRTWPAMLEIPELPCHCLAIPGRRVVVVAPHPDDELLGCAGLLVRLANFGCRISIVAVTDGGGSHPKSRHWTPARLKRTRPTETLEACRRVGLGNLGVVRLGFADGSLANRLLELEEVLASMLCPTDLVLVTWADDGHPDHEAAGSAALAAASRTDAQCIEVPVWAWHWATPGDLRIPWERAWRIPLEKALLERKRIALQAYRSQIEPDPDPAHAGRTILSSAALQRYLRPYEIVFL